MGRWNFVVGVGVVAASGDAVPAGLHPTRSALLVVQEVAGESGDLRRSGSAAGESAAAGEPGVAMWAIGGAVQVGSVIGALGEVDPGVVDAFGLDSDRRRIGWLEVDLGLLLGAVARRSPLVDPVSRFPSSDVDLAFVVPNAVAAGAVERTMREAAGELLERVELFDVFRGSTLPTGFRSLAYRVRFCALDRTLTDEEVASVRQRCIVAVGAAHGAQLRA